MKFGARILKTGLAVTLAFWLSEWLGLSPGIYAALAAILTIQPSIYRSWKHFLEQIQANLIGAIIGITFATLFGTNPIIVGIAIIIVIGLNLQLRFDKSIGLSIVTVVIIMESTADNYFLFALNRLSLILLGILSSLIVNALFLPPKYEHKLLEKIKKNQEQFAFLLRFRLEGDLMEKRYRDEKRTAKDLLQESIELYRLHQEEKHYIRKRRFATSRKMAVFRQMIECNQQARNILRTIEKLHPHLQQVDPSYQKEIKIYLEQLIYAHEKILLRFMGTVRPQTVGALEKDGIQKSKEMMDLTQRECEQVPFEARVPMISMIGELLKYTTELKQLDRLIQHYLKHK